MKKLNVYTRIKTFQRVFYDTNQYRNLINRDVTYYLHENKSRFEYDVTYVTEIPDFKYIQKGLLTNAKCTVGI